MLEPTTRPTDKLYLLAALHQISEEIDACKAGVRAYKLKSSPINSELHA